jgi:hypothetical protein
MGEVKGQLSHITFLLSSYFYGAHPPNPRPRCARKQIKREEMRILKKGEREKERREFSLGETP